ncbi:hypothetical protein [Streptomyces sp. NPDC091371]|uniref:hypothetical protein n=1 Tax=Streptomyces sp. NPDC091371 TaxID=3155303 RepID=UPI003412D07E
MDPHGQIARRFPLVARFRPACLPLHDRVQALVALAGTAATTTDQGLASAVYNQAALIASDLDLPDLARAMCHQHAAAYLHAAPLPAMTAIRALEPVVNLARLQIRAGHADHGRERLLRLSAAISNSTAEQFDDVHIPADLTQTAAGRQEVRAWLWRVLLADGARTLTSAGRWTEALAHTKEHRGIGKRMFDGRQIAVVAALTNKDTARAAELIADTAVGDPWEQAVTACLNALLRRSIGRPVDDQANQLESAFLAVPAARGMTVFEIRLGLTALDAIGSDTHPAAGRIANALHRRVLAANDGAAAREVMANLLFSALATPSQAQSCRDLVKACGLGSGSLPSQLRHALQTALQLGDRVIRDSLTPACNRRTPAPRNSPSTTEVPSPPPPDGHAENLPRGTRYSRSNGADMTVADGARGSARGAREGSCAPD